MTNAADSEATLKFGTNSAFQLEVRRRVDEYFRISGRRQRDCWQMYLKTAILVAGLAVVYLLLVFVAHAWWQGVALAVLLGFAAAGIGFNVQHDGGHHAYSDSRWVNKLMAMTLDMMGGSSYLWYWKHVVIHHTYVNVTGHDTDINLGLLGRVTPHQPRLAFHRWQHLYLWPLYGLLAVKWHFVDDFRRLITGLIGSHRVRRPTGWDLILLVAGKATFLAWAFGVPLLFHPVTTVLAFYGIAAVVLGIALSVVFQLAHCVEEAAFPLPVAGTGRIEQAWAIHQAEATVNFARPSRTVAWLLGGLNFQIEHHLFPRISHVHYPAISKLVEQTCRDFGVAYTEHRSFREGLISHFRWLRRMGTDQRPLQGRVDEIDEMTNVRVLPAAAPLIHGVAEGDPCVRIAEPERAAGAKVPECARVGAERALGHRELEAEPEAGGALQHDVVPIDLLLGRAGDGRRGENVNAV